jgi:hypothetical protein
MRFWEPAQGPQFGATTCCFDGRPATRSPPASVSRGSSARAFRQSSTARALSFASDMARLNKSSARGEEAQALPRRFSSAGEGTMSRRRSTCRTTWSRSSNQLVAVALNLSWNFPDLASTTLAWAVQTAPVRTRVPEISQDTCKFDPRIRRPRPALVRSGCLNRCSSSFCLCHSRATASSGTTRTAAISRSSSATSLVKVGSQCRSSGASGGGSAASHRATATVVRGGGALVCAAAVA